MEREADNFFEDLAKKIHTPGLKFRSDDWKPLSGDDTSTWRQVLKTVWFDKPQQDFIEISYADAIGAGAYLNLEEGIYAKAQYDAEGAINKLTLQAQPFYEVELQTPYEWINLEDYNKPENKTGTVREFVNFVRDEVFAKFDYQIDLRIFTNSLKAAVDVHLGGDWNKPEIAVAKKVAKKAIQALLQHLPEEEREEVRDLFQKEWLTEQFASELLAPYNLEDWKLSPDTLKQTDIEIILFHLMDRKMNKIHMQNQYMKSFGSFAVLEGFNTRGFCLQEIHRDLTATGQLRGPQYLVDERAKAKNFELFGEDLHIQDKGFHLTNDGRIISITAFDGVSKEILWEAKVPFKIDHATIRDIYNDLSADFRVIEKMLGIEFRNKQLAS